LESSTHGEGKSGLSSRNKAQRRYKESQTTPTEKDSRECYQAAERVSKRPRNNIRWRLPWAVQGALEQLVRQMAVLIELFSPRLRTVQAAWAQQTATSYSDAKWRIVTLGKTGDELTRPFRGPVAPIPLTRLYPVPRATRTAKRWDLLIVQGFCRAVPNPKVTIRKPVSIAP
jgi:hypothetical protein